MRPRARTTRAPLGQPARLAAGLLVALHASMLAAPLGGCAADRPAGSASAHAADDPFAVLRGLAQRPPAKRADIPPPDPALRELSAGDPAWPSASVSLDDLASDGFEAAPHATGEEPSGAPGGGTEALLLYARARQRTVAGDPSAAVSLLERATELDPTAPEPWRALGDARRAALFEKSAGAAYVRAAELGIDEPEALTLAGLHAATQGEAPKAAAFLLRAVRARPLHADPLIGFVAHAALGEALLDLGYTRAGAEALSVGVNIPRAARVPTNVGREAADLQRNRATLFVRTGDARATLGAYNEAATAYAKAAAIPGSQPVQERLVYALRKSGNDAGAALVLLDELNAGAAVTPGVTRALASVATAIPKRTAVADALASIDDRGSATRRARLTVARSVALPKDKALALLERSLVDDPDITSPARLALIGAGLARFDGTEADRAYRWTARVVARDPSSARDAAMAILHAPGLPAGVEDRIGDAGIDEAAGRALREELALRLEDRGAILDALETVARDDRPSALERRVRLAAAVGDWAAADDAISALRGSAPAANAMPSLTAALRSVQRFGLALDEARVLADTRSQTQTVDTLLALASLELIASSPDRAQTAMEAARDTDPLDERVYAALLSLHGPNGRDPDAEAVAEIGRQIRAVLPESTILRQMLAGEMLRRRLHDEAARLLIPRFRADPTAPAVLDGVLNLWRARATVGDAEANELGLVEAEASRRPNAPGLVRLIAGGLTLGGDAAGGVTAIDAFEDATGDRSLAGLREQIIRDGLRDRARADALAMARLAPLPRSIDASVQLASMRAANGDGIDVDAVLGALRSVPAWAGLTGAQQVAAQNAVTRAAVAVDTQRRARDGAAGADRSGDNAPMLALLDWALGRGLSLAPGIHELRLVMLAESGDEGGSADTALIDAAETAMAAGPSTVRAFTRRASDLLVERGSTDRAFRWLASRSLRGDELDPQAFQEWFRLVIIAGGAADTDRGRAMIDRLEAAGRLAPAWTLVRPDIEGWADRDAGDPAEMAYLLAVFVPDQDGSGGARRAYLRLALDYDPRHPWACNDLGYTMLDSGGDLAEAERLIEIAYNAKPDRANIVDSLGWVRYHLGKLEDTTDPETGASIPGAVTLLQRAVALSEPDDDGVVHDHLGDALYAAGRTERAIEAWRTAARMANQSLSRLRASGQTGGVRSEELSDLAVRAIMKPNAITMGEPPEIEPQRGVDTNDAPPGATEERRP